MYTPSEPVLPVKSCWKVVLAKRIRFKSWRDLQLFLSELAEW